MSYITPMFDKIVIKLPAELMRTVQPFVCGTIKTPKQSKRERERERERESDIVLILHEL